MAIEIKQTTKLTQQLVITPQLQQAIRLLQLTRLELVEMLSQEMKENPLLEEAEEVRDEAGTVSRRHACVGDIRSSLT